MCGIAGFMSNRGAPPAEAMLDALEEALAHRGPDGNGRFRAGGFAMVPWPVEYGVRGSDLLD